MQIVATEFGDDAVEGLEAARAAKIGERTATRRLTDPSFRRRLVELRADMVNRALGKLADGMSDAAVRPEIQNVPFDAFDAPFRLNDVPFSGLPAFSGSDLMSQ